MTKNNWKEEFDKEFQNREIIGDRTFREYCKYLYPDIQDFIQSLLDKQKEEIIKILDNTDIEMSVNGSVSQDTIAMAKFLYKAHILHIKKKLEKGNGILPTNTDSAMVNK